MTKQLIPAHDLSVLIKKIQKGLEHQKKKEMGQAENIFTDCLKEYPKNIEVLQIAVIFFDQIKKYQRVSELAKKILENEPNNLIGLRLEGKFLLTQGDYNAAKILLARLIALKPDDAEALFYMGCVFHRTAEFGLSEKFYRESLKFKDSSKAIFGLGQILLITNQKNEVIKILHNKSYNDDLDYDREILLALAQGLYTLDAMNSLFRAFSIDETREEAKSLLGHVFSNHCIPANLDKNLERIIHLCILSNNVSPESFGRVWMSCVFDMDDQKGPSLLLRAANYEDFKRLYLQKDFRENLLTPFFNDGVEKIMVFNVALELMFTRLRRFYLELILERGDLEAAEERFLKSLSVQAFLNEFIFEISLPEEVMFSELDPAVYLHTLIFSCYRPLSLLANVSFDRSLSGIVKVQVENPASERFLSSKVKAFGRMKNQVSIDVQEQYEQNPYPRWVGYNRVPSILNDSVDNRFVRKKRVLVAGCGTGRNVLSVHSSCPDADITAVDLSGASLAYAMRKCEEFNIGCDFFKGDLLQIESLGGNFDIVECMGVLHHMEDPEAGLSALCRVLNDDGELRLALYSERARHEVVEAHKIIKEKGFCADDKGIRAAREYLKGCGLFKNLISSTDFFTMSACRDLIFHVQEVRFGLVQIKEMLIRNGLVFSGFILSPSKLTKFKDKFPDVGSELNLDLWDLYEKEDPLFFASMYQFVCKKKSISRPI